MRSPACSRQEKSVLSAARYYDADVQVHFVSSLGVNNFSSNIEAGEALTLRIFEAAEFNIEATRSL